MAAETQLDFIMRFKDEASAQVAKAGSNLSSFKDKVESLNPAFQKMAMAGTAALGAITAIGLKSVKDFAEAQKASAMLEHAVVGVTGATQAQLQATSDLADELERKGVLDGDNIKMGLAQLSTFGLSNKAVQGLAGSLADLAVNQNGVSATGEQLSETANMIAKALNGQFGVLEKSGIRFTAAQQSAIKFGTEMQKVDAINQGFAQNLKFTNEVALTTAEGQMAKAAVSAGNLSEALGGVLSPIVAQLTAQVVPMLVQLQKWIEANPELTKRIVITTAAIAATVAIIGTLGLALPAIASALALLASPLGLILVAFTALTAAGVALYTNWESAKAKVAELMAKFDQATGIVTQLRQAYIEITDQVETKLKPAFDKFMETLKPYMPALQALGKLILLVIIVALKLTLEVIKDLILAFLMITTKVLEFSAALNDFFTPAANVAKSIIDSISRAVGYLIDKFVAMKAAAQEAFNIASRVAVGVGTLGLSEVARALPAFASGGIVTSPTVGLIGEAGPEAIIPLSQMGSMGGGGGVTVNIGNVWGTNPRAAAREIGDILIRELQQNRRVTT